MSDIPIPTLVDYIRSCLAQREHCKVIETKSSSAPLKKDSKCTCLISYRGLKFHVTRFRTETLEEDEKGRYSKQQRFNFKVVCEYSFLHSDVVALMMKEILYKGGHPQLSKDPILL